MISEKQLEANRRNAQNSTGPKTDEGKQRCNQNARRHGLTGQVSVMLEEDRIAYDKYCGRIIKSLAPQGAMELDLAVSIADDRWRLHRMKSIEDNILALGFLQNGAASNAGHPQISASLTAANTFKADVKHFQLIALYGQRLKRGMKNDVEMLREFQAEREEILKHKWIESEKAGYDIGFERALTDWIVKYRSKWRKARQAQHPQNSQSN